MKVQFHVNSFFSVPIFAHFTHYYSLSSDRAKRARNRELRAEGKTDVESENEDEESTEEEELEESDRNLRSRQRKPPTKLM